MSEATGIDAVSRTHDLSVRRSIVRRRLFALLVAYWIALFVGTHLPGGHTPDLGPLDKVAHFGGYCGLAFLLSAWLLTLRWSALRIAVVVLTVLVTYAVADELLQVVVARHTDFWDWVADVLGTTTGLAAAIALRGLFRSEAE